MQARIRYNNIRFNVIKSTTRVGTSADSFALFPTLTITQDRVTRHENRTNSTLQSTHRGAGLLDRVKFSWCNCVNSVKEVV